MKKYKVEITETTNYVIDVLANNEQAEQKAQDQWLTVCDNGTYHYHQTGNTETEVSQVYDVTDTDDPHDPIN